MSPVSATTTLISRNDSSLFIGRAPLCVGGYSYRQPLASLEGSGRRRRPDGGVDGEKLLRRRDAAQGVAADGEKILPPMAQPVDEGRRHQQRLIDRTAHRGDAADLVD